ncbi:MAG TPA: hypothetical protein PLR44_01965 [Thermomicrobiales bacterium]|jgi:hypothetical protein|nr:hypothetical protein [Chloroflexota bacterium]HBY46280.1 hypothetical protein [Chloroflexota bacterium]HCG29182.1 hypothetical protein [Chloroflexota bacterium]HQZ88793.1 hypothetical protein [Thermomicrobiales bacterium]HRA32812.1 hypothetical protein [Thermomicrobiales bacterium]
MESVQREDEASRYDGPTAFGFLDRGMAIVAAIAFAAAVSLLASRLYQWGVIVGGVPPTILTTRPQLLDRLPSVTRYKVNAVCHGGFNILLGAAVTRLAWGDSGFPVTWGLDRLAALALVPMGAVIGTGGLLRLYRYGALAGMAEINDRRVGADSMLDNLQIIIEDYEARARILSLPLHRGGRPFGTTRWPSSDDLNDSLREFHDKTGRPPKSKGEFCKFAGASVDTLNRHLERFGIKWDNVKKPVDGGQ